MSATDVPHLLNAAAALAGRKDTPPAETEIAIAGLVSLFEARLQHHFARGPFFQKLSARLTAEGHTALAQSLHHYYLATNVLKRGPGKSHRELLDTADLPFAVGQADRLIDVSADGFLEGLVTTLEEAYRVLEGA